MRRQIFTDGCNSISTDDVTETTSKHLRLNAIDQSSSRQRRCTKMNQPLPNLVSDQLIAAKFINWSSRNEQLKPASWNPVNTSRIQSEHHNHLHSTDEMETARTKEVQITNQSTVFQSGKPGVQLRYCSFHFKYKAKLLLFNFKSDLSHGVIIPY